MRCIKVEHIEHEADLCDLEIDGGENNYMAEGVVAHNTWCQIGVLPEGMAHEEYGTLVVASKGLADKGLAFKPDAEENKNNLYLRANRGHRISEKVREVAWFTDDAGNVVFDKPVFVLGEVYGQGVQDLHYGASTAKDETLGFRCFDIYLGVPGKGRYLNDQELDAACEDMGIERVPVLYRGPFSRDVMVEYTTGRETVTGKSTHIREGIVMKPVKERRDDLSGLGRVMLKSVSEQYLLRKSKNATEYA